MGFSNGTELSDVLNDAYVSGVVSVGTSAVEAKVGGSPLATRERLVIYNDSNKTVYWGPSSVTISGSTKGIPLGSGQMVMIPAGANLSVYLVSDSLSNNVIVQELG